MKNNIVLFILTFWATAGFSQETTKKTEFYPINTKDVLLEKGAEVLLEKNLFLIAFDSLPIRTETHMLNFEVAADGKITFIKGHKGFSKAEIPYELIGIQIPEYENDELINKLNALVANIKVIHQISNKDSAKEKQPDCSKLKNVIFYGYIKMQTVLQKS